MATEVITELEELDELEAGVDDFNEWGDEFDLGFDDADEDLLAGLDEAAACSLENPTSCETCQ